MNTPEFFLRFHVLDWMLVGVIACLSNVFIFLGLCAFIYYSRGQCYKFKNCYHCVVGSDRKFDELPFSLRLSDFALRVT